MTKVFIEKKNFDSQLIKLIAASQKSVNFYSISCCFGFYSEGLETYGNVLSAIRNALGRKVDVKILAKVDYDNPIDVYAARRFAEVEIGFSGRMRHDGVVFRELNTDAEQLQFLIVDGERILLTSFQKEVLDENLGLVLNKVESGALFQANDDPVEFDKYLSAFMKTWTKSPPLQIEVKPVSRTMVRSFLYRWTAMPGTKNEHELSQLLTGYLEKLFNPLNVTVAPSEIASRIEITVRNRRRHERYGIEIKLNPDDEYANEIVGKLVGSQEKYDGGFELLVVHPKYAPEKGNHLRDQLSKIDIGLIELK
jgi:hypothetical protein